MKIVKIRPLKRKKLLELNTTKNRKKAVGKTSYVE